MRKTGRGGGHWVSSKKPCHIVRVMGVCVGFLWRLGAKLYLEKRGVTARKQVVNLRDNSWNIRTKRKGFRVGVKLPAWGTHPDL